MLVTEDQSNGIADADAKPADTANDTEKEEEEACSKRWETSEDGKHKSKCSWDKNEKKCKPLGAIEMTQNMTILMIQKMAILVKTALIGCLLCSCCMYFCCCKKNNNIILNGSPLMPVYNFSKAHGELSPFHQEYFSSSTTTCC